jgi:hypothetical protein
LSENIFIALTNPIAGQDDAFNAWYDTEHVPEVLAIPGVVSAQRYDVVELPSTEDPDLPTHLPPPTHRYMVIYGLDDRPEVVMEEFLTRVRAGTMTLSEWLDVNSISLTGWKPRSERQSSVG